VRTDDRRKITRCPNLSGTGAEMYLFPRGAECRYLDSDDKTEREKERKKEINYLILYKGAIFLI
jgi:hypothetical protein